MAAVLALALASAWALGGLLLAGVTSALPVVLDGRR